MPTYEYRCDSCSKKFDVVQKMSDEPLTACPDCGNAVQQIFSAGFGLSFSGNGFYTTDTKKKDTISVGETATETSNEAEKPDSDTSCEAASSGE